MLPSILDRMDRDIINRLGLSLRKQGIKTMTSSRVKNLRLQDDILCLAVENAKGTQEVTAEKVLVAIGRAPRMQELDLEAAGVAYDGKGIFVNKRMETNVPGVYAVGDVTGLSMLAHAASAAAAVAAENACGQSASMSFARIPACVFTSPEAAGVGLTEQEAEQKGLPVQVSKANFAGNGKAMTIGETDGFVKVLADGDGRVLGVHILGPHASDLIMEGALAVSLGLTAQEVARTVHPHPTLSEVVMDSAHGIFGQPVHQLQIGRK
jgi:dihydrolipoamide dehydrogenase